jgi:hypothetical protein
MIMRIRLTKGSLIKGTLKAMVDSKGPTQNPGAKMDAGGKPPLALALDFMLGLCWAFRSTPLDFYLLM